MQWDGSESLAAFGGLNSTKPLQHAITRVVLLKAAYKYDLGVRAQAKNRPLFSPTLQHAVMTSASAFRLGGEEG